MDPRDLYKIVRSLDSKIINTTSCSCGGNCKCNKKSLTEGIVQSDPINKFIENLKSSDDPFVLIYDGLLGRDGLEVEEYLQPKYEQTAQLHGWHPDDDFERIIDQLVAELTDDLDAQELAAGEDEQDIEDDGTSLSDIKTLAYGNDN